MARNRTYNKKNLMIIVSVIIIAALGLTARLSYLMIFKSEDYAARAKALHERERAIKAERQINRFAPSRLSIVRSRILKG